MSRVAKALNIASCIALLASVLASARVSDLSCVARYRIELSSALQGAPRVRALALVVVVVVGHVLRHRQTGTVAGNSPHVRKTPWECGGLLSPRPEHRIRGNFAP